MKKIIYHKLVRDRIPEIIEASGNTCVTEILSDEEYLRMVDGPLRLGCVSMGGTPDADPAGCCEGRATTVPGQSCPGGETDSRPGGANERAPNLQVFQRGNSGEIRKAVRVVSDR